MTASAEQLEAIWHDVECGAYAADLPAWARIATAAPGAVLELGAGTGRVALHLAARGFDVVALDQSPALLEELRSRMGTLPVRPVRGDARELDRLELLNRRFGAILAPMQLVQVLGGAEERAAMLRGALTHLGSGGVIACAVLDDDAEAIAGGPGAALLPDVREIDGWIYSSQPVSIARASGEIVIRRLRQTVSPTGELTEEPDSVRLQSLSVDELEAEAAASGLRARDRISVPATADHVGSTICVLEAG